MPSYTVRLDHGGMRKLLLGAGIRGDLRSRAEVVAEAARGSAPIDTGAYQASIDTKLAVTDRIVARVTAAVPYALVVEAKTRTLGRALDAAGGGG